MEALTTLELIGVIVGISVGVFTILSLVFLIGIRIGRLVTRDDLNDARADLDKKIDETRTDLEKKIDDTAADLERKIRDDVARLDRRIDEVLVAIQNLGTRLENAILDHTHDEDGVAIFRRHPQMADTDD